jgi:light-regulated signal transduction histidine kinase (bacteriophytochrome)
MWNMSDVPMDPRWSKILSLSVHEFRSPLTVVAGYIRMLLKDRAGPLSDQQRHLLEEAEKSCGRLTSLLQEVSDLSTVEAGGAPLKLQRADLHAMLRAAVEQLPPLPEGEVTIDLQLGSGPAPISADPARLTEAFKSILGALRRELVTSNRLVVREHAITHDRKPAFELRIGDEETLAVLDAEGNDGRVTFDEWRGGNGMILPVARRILEAHGARIWNPPDNPPTEEGRVISRKAGARVMLPRASRARPAKRVV